MIGSTGERVGLAGRQLPAPALPVRLPQAGDAGTTASRCWRSRRTRWRATTTSTTARYTDAGADIFWKPNGQMQLTATINPDFGQVESDDLVVNFSANETFFSDKRPFFTENQGIFEFATPSRLQPAAVHAARRRPGRRRQRPRRHHRGGEAQRQPGRATSTACSPPRRPMRSGARSARCAWCAISTSRTSA